MSSDALILLQPVKEIPASGILSDCAGRCLILSMRHLGDAVIGSGFINSLQRHNPNMPIDVLGRPEVEEVIRTLSSIHEFINIDVPVFGHHRRNVTACAAAVRTMRMIRKRQYDYCINLIGDIRENAIGYLVGATWNIAPIWERGHIFKKKMTDTGASKMANCGIVIPKAYPSFYESMRYFGNQLGLSGLEWRNNQGGRGRLDENIVIAIHPGASHRSRHWPEDRWRALIAQLCSRGYSIKILGAQSERGSLLSAYERQIGDHSIELVTEDIAGFMSNLAVADALIGMDSFSVHAAYALSVPVVVLNGSADSSILTPPGGEVVSSGHLCPNYPCYYDYPCQMTANEYICVRAIDVDTVMEALNVIIERRDTAVNRRGSRIPEYQYKWPGQ